MKNIMVVDDSQDYFFDVHVVSDDDFSRIFPNTGQNVEFHDDLYTRDDIEDLGPVFERMWYHRISTRTAKGIDGLLFYENWDRKNFYFDKVDVEDCRSISTTVGDKQIICFHKEPSAGIYASAISSSTCAVIFSDGGDVEFFEDLRNRTSVNQLQSILNEIERGRTRKRDIKGIEGVLYFGYPEKKEYFCTKIDSDIPRHYPLFSNPK